MDMYDITVDKLAEESLLQPRTIQLYRNDVMYRPKFKSVVAICIGMYLHPLISSEVLGIEVQWNAERKRVTADGKLLDIHTEIYNGNAYCYVRDLAKETGHSIEYNSVDKSITIS